MRAMPSTRGNDWEHSVDNSLRHQRAAAAHRLGVVDRLGAEGLSLDSIAPTWARAASLKFAQLRPVSLLNVRFAPDSDYCQRSFDYLGSSNRL
jgi:hypothetical protein